MNYQQKYLKYKNKYINLKKQTGGFNPLFNTNSGLLSSKIIGNTPIKLNERLTNLFKKYWIASDSEDKIKYSSDGKTLELFPSDHFGVITNFSLNLHTNSRPCHYPL